MAVNPHLRAAQLALNSTAAYRKFIRIDESPTGEIVFTNVATGQKMSDMGSAISSVDSLGLVDYRLFSPRPTGGPLDNFRSTSGVNQFDSEIQYINQWLRSATSDPARMKELRDVGLEHLAGQSINGRFFKFNTRGQQAMIQEVAAEFPLSQIATSSLTDEGYTLLQYARADGTALSGRESKLLKHIMGVGPIQSSFIKKLIQNDEYSDIAKLAKRLQSTMSPRDVMLGESFISSFLESDVTRTVAGMPVTSRATFESRVMRFDGVAGQLEIMLRDRGIEGAGLRPSGGLSLGPTDRIYGDRVVAFGTTPGFRLTDQEKAFVDAGALGEDLSPKAGLSRIEAMDQRLTLRRQKLLEQAGSTYGFSETEMDRVAQLWEEATQQVISDPDSASTPGTTAEKILKVFKKKTEALYVGEPAHSRPFLPIKEMSNRSLQGKINTMLGGLEKSRDGQFMVTPTFLRDIKSAYEAQLESFLGPSSTSGFIGPRMNFTREQVQEIEALQKQIEAINKALEKVGKGDIIARINLGFGQIKGEAYVVPERIASQFMSGPFDDLMPYIISDVTNIKGEVGSQMLRNIGANIGENKPGVFSDPLMFLYHGEYFSQPSMIEAMKENATATISKAKEFMTSGDVPQEVLRELEQEMSGEIGGKNLASRLKLDADLLDPVSRASYLRKRQEAQEIMNALSSGVDPRQIPQLVRRINDFYNAKVVRLKNGRADVLIPTAESFSLRTLESSLDEGRNFSPMTKIGIDLSSYGVTVRGGSSAELNFVNFRIQGKRMLLAGEAAYKYQHSLGGFDLDDKGIPLMSTFVDRSGRKRLAFMTLRQPTSFQESLAQTADLTDAETVNKLFKNNTRFKEALTNDTALAALGIDKNSDQYKNLVRMVTGRGERTSTRVDYNAVEDMIIKLSESADVFPAGLPSLTTSQVIRMAMTQDASLLGLQRMTSSGSEVGKMMQGLGLDPSSNPVPYDSETIFQIFRKKQDAKLNSQLLQKVSQELGINITSKDELLEIMEKRGPRFRPGMENQVAAIAEEFITGIMEKGASGTVEESIGLFINRQAAAVNILESSRSILEKEFGITAQSDLFKDFQDAASIFTLPASEAVDYSKQISLEQVLTNFGSALTRMTQEGGISQEAVEETLRAYMRSAGQYTETQMNEALEILNVGGIKLKLDPLGQQMLRSHAGVGFVRAKQIAEQIADTGTVDRSSLLGLQQTLYDDTLGYARIKSLDQTAAANEILKGLQAYIESGEGRSLTTQQREAINLEMSTIRAAGTGAKQIESLFMAPGTDAYDKYAQHDQLVRAITDIQRGAEISKSSNISESRRLQLRTEPVVKAKFQTQSKNIVEDIRSNLESIGQKVKELKNIKSAADAETFNIRAKRIETLRSIYERMSAVKSAEISAGRTFTGADMLDLADSIEAQMAKFLDTQEAAKIVTSELISEDDKNITFMMELFGAARKRRLAMAQKDRIDLHQVARVDEIYGGAVGTGVRTRTNAALSAAGLPDMPANIADVSVEQANEAIKAIRVTRKGLAKGTGTAAEREELQILSELMSRIKGGEATGAKLAQFEGASKEAESAFRYYFQGSRHVMEAEETAANLVANGLLADADIPAAAADAATRAATSASTRTAAATVYKRIEDSFKTGALGDMLKNKNVKRGLIAAAALSAFGFIYSARKDHNESAVTGPPLMPGGNPYEEGLPQLSLSIQENINTVNPVTRGMQYRIYTTGSMDDTERLSSMLNGVVDGPINSTMYNSLPRLGQDPYSQVASNF